MDSSQAVSPALHTRLLAYYRRNNKGFNVATNTALILLCLACYALLIISFVSPSSFHLQSLVYADVGGIKPAVTVTLLSVALATATLALVTRLIEHHFWLRLKPALDNRTSGLQLRELKDLAEWTISPLARIRYALDGSVESWAVKLTGILLLGTGVLGPVLVSGVSQVDNTSIQISNIPRDQRLAGFAGFVDDTNDAYMSGTFRDVPTFVAATYSLTGMSAPMEKTLCPVDDPRCSVKTKTASIQAKCGTKLLENPPDAPVGSLSVPNGFVNAYTREFRSELNPILKVTLRSSNPNGFANFTTAPRNLQDYFDTTFRIPNGTFGYVFGAYVPVDNFREFETGNPIRIVDCRLAFGTVIIEQVGGSPPVIEPDSFAEASTSVFEEKGLSVIQRIYNEPFGNDISPFSFQASQAGASGGSNLADSVIGQYLLGTSAAEGRDPEVIARRIEKAWDMATVMAWIRAPQAAEATNVTRRNSRRVYVYKVGLLGYLAVPLLATLLALIATRAAVGGKEDVLGYDPLAIATIGGPIEGLGNQHIDHGFLSVGREKDAVFGVFRHGRRTWAVAGSEAVDDGLIVHTRGVQVEPKGY